jgi:hypothetical protein
MAGLVSLAGVMLAILVASNRKFQKTMPVKTPEDEPALQNDAGV